MENKVAEQISVTRIPFPNHLLKGDWGGIVYSICTSQTSAERHSETVEAKIKEIINEYNKTNHWSVSLRFVKKETVVSFDVTDTYLTLVQFRVRDSY